jgi:hypothetical protein
VLASRSFLKSLPVDLLIYPYLYLRYENKNFCPIDDPEPPCCSITPVTSLSLYICRAVQDLHTSTPPQIISSPWQLALPLSFLFDFAGTQQETASNGRNGGPAARSDPSAAPPASDRRPPRAAPGQRRRPARLGRRVRRHHPRRHALRRRGRWSGVLPRRVLRLPPRRVAGDAGACRRPVPESGKGRRGRRDGDQPLPVRPWVVSEVASCFTQGSTLIRLVYK